MLLWLIETEVFQMPQLHKHFNVSCYLRMFPKLRKLFLGLLILTIILGVFSIKHFVLIRWITGTATIIGRPINATVYTNGQINRDVKVYHINKHWSGESTDDFILHFTYVDSDSTIETIRIERKRKTVSRP